MPKSKEKMPYIFGEPEGLGRKEQEEAVEEEKRLTQEDRSPLQSRRKHFTRGIEEVSLSDIPEEEIAETDSLFAQDREEDDEERAGVLKDLDELPSGIKQDIWKQLAVEKELNPKIDIFERAKFLIDKNRQILKSRNKKRKAA